MTYPRFPLYPSTYPSTYGPVTPPFPDITLDVMTELLINGAWTDVTPWNEHGPVSTGRGHPDESTQTPPSTASITLTNTDGRFTSRNPMSPYYPYLMRNIGCRVSIPARQPYLRLEGSSAGWAQATDNSRLQITGDLDIRCDIKPTSYQHVVIASKADLTTGTGYGWILELEPDMTLRFFWSPDGGTTIFSGGSGVPVPFGRITVRVALTTISGTPVFFTGPGVSGPWTQLGTPASATGGAGTSVWPAAGIPLRAGYCPGTGAGPMTGNFHELQVWSGTISGTLEADAVFGGVAAGTYTWTDAQSNTWWVQGTGEISSRMYRFHGEAAEWPQQPDASGKTITVPVAAGGLMRRTGQRTATAGSPMLRAYTKSTATAPPVAYWPMEDGASAQSCASALGGPAMWFSGAPKMASSSTFTCSDPLPVLNGCTFSGLVPAYTALGTANVCRFLLAVPSGGEPNGSLIATMTGNGTIATMTLSYGTGGTLTLTGWDNRGNQLFSSGGIAFGVNGVPMRMSIMINSAGQPAGTLQWMIETLQAGATVAFFTAGTISGTLGAARRVQLNPGGQLTQTAAGHCSVQTVYDNLFDLQGAFTAWQNERAGNRFARICGEEMIPFRARGNLGSTIAMGPQTSQTVTALLQECTDADRGIWTELRQAGPGWGYIPRSALYNQAAAVTLDYAQDHLALWPQAPKEDDQTTINDVTLTQTSGGSSARQFAAPGQPVTGGRLSTLPPPAGCGTYDQTYNVNIVSPDDLSDMAGWIVHTGTADSQRYPAMSLDLANRDLASLYWNIAGLDIGDRIVIINPPAYLGPDPVTVLINGIQEELFSDTFKPVVNGIPELPYEVAQDGAGYHFDTDGSTLVANVTATATSLLIATITGAPLWTTNSGDLPFDIGISGERMTVTNITGSSSPQTMTVVRSVNGVIKPQLAATAVALWQTPVLAL